MHLSNPALRRGFTLIELLVVIAIISLLSSVVIASLNSARTKGRDARRMEDLREIQHALAMHATSGGGAYPVSASQVTLTNSDAVSTSLKTGGSITTVPVDPLAGTYDYKYQSTNGSTYTLTFCLETNTIKGFVAGCTNTLTP